MSDPALQTFCCYPPDKIIDHALFVLMRVNSESYNYICMMSSFIGICGAIYQMLPREETPLAHRWYTLTASRGREIIHWLAVADFFASLGVFLRSVLKLNRFLYPMDSMPITFCAFFAAWIQYFYCVTWMWTLCYAVDMSLALWEKPGRPVLYHAFCWLLPTVLTAVGLTILYLPNADCHNPEESAFLRILPNYLLNYLPMLAVMVANPVLYVSSMGKVSTFVSHGMAQFTSKERAIVHAVKLKFGLILLVFYICWLPNLVNSVIIWTKWRSLPSNSVSVLLYIMAALNPMQALFNSLVYRRTYEKLVFRFPHKKPTEATPLIPADINSSTS